MTQVIPILSRRTYVRTALSLSLIMAAAAARGVSTTAARQQQGPVTQPQQRGARENPLAELNRLVNEIYAKVRAARERGGFYAALDALRASEPEYAARGGDAHVALATMLLQAEAEAGNYAEAIRHGDVGGQRYPLDPPPDGQALGGYRPADAAAAVARAATATRVVVVNEAHHVPQHRAFTFALLKALREKGYRYFAAETLFEFDAKLNERGYPTQATGAYTNEPVYGDLVRTALGLGYRIVPYEPQFRNQDQRERDQARNIFERTLKADPGAKVLVHVGYEHNSEATPPAGRKMMAAYLKELAGVDPLTIDQTLMSEHSAPEYEHPLYRYATARGLVRAPAVFVNAAGDLFTAEKGRRDVTVFQPRSRYADGRPTWLRLGGARKPYRLPRDVCGPVATCLVQARAAGESADAIPIDRVEVRTGSAAPALMLPRGEFVVEAVDVGGRRVREFPVLRK